MTEKRMRIAVIGGGSWGTALAFLLAENGHDLDLWVFEEEVRESIATSHENSLFLPGCTLPKAIRPTTNLEEAVSNKDLVLVVVPSHHMRTIAKEMAPFLKGDTLVVTASKGIENKTHLTMTGVLDECLPEIPSEQIMVLSGPSFAREVAERIPTVVAVAGKNPEFTKRVQETFASPVFRVYTNEDPIGVEIGGAMKNVIAIAAGMCDGLKSGLNPRAALITRGLTEMKRLGKRLGADPLTFSGLAGVGDLILTCTGDLSRNHTVGMKIASGMSLDDILNEMRMVAEGVKTTRSVYNLSHKLGVELPICNEVYHILFDGRGPRESITRLMTRDLKEEMVL
ncbi:MAG: NAD(P)-dependent glycerol-3-phosphate dehydrogenase [Desulfobacterales bacterium]|nr:NAD(P)-dependent glycerol-3-phosphate dehydrogenase [Desulfobacterales bacterium]